MANPEHLKILKQGKDIWNKWREANPKVTPNFEGADLSVADLSWMNLNDANFIGANLALAQLIGTKLDRADLRGAYLGRALLLSTSLIEASLEHANLMRTNLTDANLCRANLEQAYITNTIFADTNLSETKGLDKLDSIGWSIIDHRTFRKTKNLPKKFLRDCGLPDQLIDNFPDLVNSIEPIQFYSCFISHSSNDEEFAQRLYADLQAKGIRCWYAPENLKIGDEISPTIDKAIRVHEKLLLIFSENSITSAWVKKEAKEAMATEKDKGKKDVLFPIRLDDSIMDTTEQWCDDVKRERHIGDFRNWKNHDAYQKSFARLIRDLKNEGS